MGDRNNLFWLMSNALSWSCGGYLPEFERELVALYQDLFQVGGWKFEEAEASASSIARRMTEPVTWATGKYKFRTSTWLDRMDVTQAEIQEYGHLLGPRGGLDKRWKDHWKRRSMGFDKPQNLPFDQFLAEVRYRQAQAGRRSAEIRHGTYGLDIRLKALQMSSEGLSQASVAVALGVSQQSVSRWLRGTK